MSSLFASSRSLTLDDKIEADSIIRPPSQVLSLAELEGVPLILSGDSKGLVSAWHIASSDRRTEEPEQFFEAHTGPVNSVLILSSSRVSNIVEECEWPKNGPSRQRKFSVSLEQQLQQIKSGRGSVVSTVSDQDPKKISSVPGTDVQPLAGAVDTHDEEPPKNCLKKMMAKMCCCKCSSQSGGEERFRHWMLATAGDDGALRIWRFRALSQGTSHFEVDFITEWNSRGLVSIVSCVELHDGTLAVALKASNDAIVVDPCAATIKWVLYGHLGPVTALAQCVDGRIATGGEDGAVRLWERRTWEEEDETEVPAKAWADPANTMPGIGVSSMAYFAHTQQQQKSESVKVLAHIFIRRAENLPKADLFGASDPYVIVSLSTGNPETVRDRSPAKRANKQVTTFQHCSQIPLSSEVGKGPESAIIDFEVYSTGRFCCGKDTLLGICSIPLDEVVAELQSDPVEARTAKHRKLHAPVGEGPFHNIMDATLLVGFESRAPKTIDCLIDSAEFLPLSCGQKAYVVTTMRTSTVKPGSRVRCVTSKVQHKTSTVLKNLNPVWDELVEIEIPATHKDHRLEYPEDLVLHFEVWDWDHVSADDLLATLDIPLSVAIENDNRDVGSFKLELAPGFKPKKNKNQAASSSSCCSKKKAKKESKAETSEVVPIPPDVPVADDGSPDIPMMKAAANSGTRVSHTGTLRSSAFSAESQDGLPRIFLGFQMITPCSKQLQCTIEHASGLAPMPAESAPMVRLKLVQGDPLLPHTTSRRTRTIRHSSNPVWNEQCILPVSESFIRHCFRMNQEQEKLLKPPPPASVRLGWEHEAPEPAPLLFCADVFAKHSNSDTLIGSCTLPLQKIILDVKNQKWHQPKQLDFDHNEGSIHLGFELAGTDLLVNIEKADHLTHNSVISADHYCVVRIAELGAFDQPSGKYEGTGLSNSTGLAYDNKTNPEFDHEMLLDLPGSWDQDFEDGRGMKISKVAMRSSWYAHIEVLEIDDYLHKEVPLMEGVVSLTELLSELATNEIPKPEPGIIRSRIDALRWGHYTDIKVEAPPPSDIEKDVELIAIQRMKRGAQQDKASLSPEDTMHNADVQPEAMDVSAPSDISGSLTNPPTAALSTPSSTEQPTLLPGTVSTPIPINAGTETTSTDQNNLSGKLSRFTSNKSDKSGRSGKSIFSLLRKNPRLSVQSSSEEEEEIPNGNLRIRFKVVSRWDGIGRERIQPLPKAMSKPSPVTCMMVLSTRLFAGYENGNVYVWDISGSSSVPLHQFEAHRVPISGLAYLQRGDVVITTGLPRTREEAVKDSVMRTWSAANLQLQQTISLHTAATRQVLALNSDSQRKKMPCLALATETRQSKLIQMMRYKGTKPA